MTISAAIAGLNCEHVNYEHSMTKNRLTNNLLHLSSLPEGRKVLYSRIPPNVIIVTSPANGRPNSIACTPNTIKTCNKPAQARATSRKA
eukprot:m.54283 g.54283  ORF g.54283 m.54283 type:complete len:89 (-) comp13613_c0_seq1:1013-1279(-)